MFRGISEQRKSLSVDFCFIVVIAETFLSSPLEKYFQKILISHKTLRQFQIKQIVRYVSKNKIVRRELT